MEIYRTTSYIFICRSVSTGNESNGKQSFPGPIFWNVPLLLNKGRIYYLVQNFFTHETTPLAEFPSEFDSVCLSVCNARSWKWFTSFFHFALYEVSFKEVMKPDFWKIVFTYEEGKKSTLNGPKRFLGFLTKILSI